jgi:predicted NUDIX family NTP pyrophosphohydrolase
VAKASAGILLYRHSDQLEVLLIHPGGPMWARKDAGAWSIPKGGIERGEDPLTAARREFAEELGSALPDDAPEPIDLGQVRLRSGKRIQAYAVPGDLDVATVVSNTTELEWPPRSGRRITVPEVDRAAWFTAEAARVALNPAQVELVERLLAVLDGQ